MLLTVKYLFPRQQSPFLCDSHTVRRGETVIENSCFLFVQTERHARVIEAYRYVFVDYVMLVISIAVISEAHWGITHYSMNTIASPRSLLKLPPRPVTSQHE